MPKSPKKRSTKLEAHPTAARARSELAPRVKRKTCVYIALLRGINVGGNRSVPMAELRTLAERCGCTHVESYIQSGNLILCSNLLADGLAARLEREIVEHFGFAVPVIVRSLAEWERYAHGSPFPLAEKERPNWLLLGLSQRPPKPGLAAALVPYAKAGENIEVRGDALWIDYHRAGVARSKLTPTVLDRAAGSPVTSRNFRTVQKLAELARAVG